MPPRPAPNAPSPAEPSDAARAALDNALQRTHRAVLLLLGACAVTIVFVAPPDEAGNDSGVVPEGYTLAAIGLSLGVVVARRLATSPVMQLRTRARLTIASLTLAGLLGLLATTLAFATGITTAALVFTLAAALFILRPPTLPRPAAGTDGR